jgi:hypothetical protein
MPLFEAAGLKTSVSVAGAKPLANSNRSCPTYFINFILPISSRF